MIGSKQLHKCCDLRLRPLVSPPNPPTCNHFVASAGDIKFKKE